MDTSHPIIRPPDVGHEPHNPVRDRSKLAPTEDIDRQPDGVPHGVVGLTALFSVMLALLVAVMFLSGHVIGQIAGVVLAVIAIPTLVATLRGKAARERDRLHPSR
jgi:membrane associated rhomboid family serine protease